MHHLNLSCIIPCLFTFAFVLIVLSLPLCGLLLLVRRRRWDRRALRLRFRGVSSVPGYWVCRQVFTHMNHYAVSSLVTDSSVVYSASHYLPMLLFSESHHMSLTALLLPHFPTYSLWLPACVVVACLVLCGLESVVLYLELFSLDDRARL